MERKPNRGFTMKSMKVMKKKGVTGQLRAVTFSMKFCAPGTDTDLTLTVPLLFAAIYAASSSGLGRHSSALRRS